MPVERAGYTVIMFLVDVSKSMGSTRRVPLPPGPDGEERFAEMTHLQYALQYVKFKIQTMTDQCGVILFGTEGISSPSDGVLYPLLNLPTATLKKLDELEPSDLYGDPIDAIIVGVHTQNTYLGNKKTWTRKVILVTDGEGPMEIEDWEATVQKMNELNVGFTVVGVDFDDEEHTEEDKRPVKRENEEFFHKFCEAGNDSIVGNLDFVLEQISLPDVKTSRSTLMHNVLRIGDTESRTDEAMEILVKTSKCTAVNRPKSFKKFAIRSKSPQEEEDRKAMDVDADEGKNVTYVQLKARSENFVDTSEPKDGEVESETKVEEDEETRLAALEKVEKEQLIRGFKYGTSYVPCPDGQFPKLPTKKGIDLIGFIPEKKFRRDWAMGEIQYIWGNPDNATAQCAISSIAQAIWVTGDGRDPKMGVMSPAFFNNEEENKRVDCLLWAPMPFQDDIRRYTFPSLDKLINKKGEILTEHPYLPTDTQLEAMDEFVDAMDLMEAGPKDEEKNPTEWFDIRDSYNPAFHRLKQAMFHCAVVADLETNPLPPPHPELIKYFNPPKKMVKRAQPIIDKCIEAFNVKLVPKVAKVVRKGAHDHAQDDDDEMLLLDRKPSTSKASQSNSSLEDSATEDEDEEMLLLDKVPPARKPNTLPTPARSLSPSSRRDNGDDSMDVDVDPQRDPHRLIGRTRPLVDFKENLKRGDIVSKSVEDMCAVIEEVVLAPFASRRAEEMMECLKELRKVCLKEDEIDAWNSFLPKLKEKCLKSTPGNEEFWSQLQETGRTLSLISDKEAEKNGGSSDVSESEATKFMD
ncbi:SPOC domain-like protein [Gymnopus androsaceus JB14]|uniref:ATP-dependent DNA helicase II subunit 2 n=1 Tax=Gymnopus androsaceus JB14 TaxID=1447944 RepID=A0A6A4HGA7_9AGAR|nr:SPOC domain-like protein [Gymnopus androsaceus JB14]